MATGRRLPSGSWRCQVYSHTDPSGKRHYASFTAPTKREAELAAAQFAALEDKKPQTITFGKALDEYIEIKSNVLSPSTIREYKGVRNRSVQSLMDIPVSRLTQVDIQRAINTEADNHAPKTVRNVYGLITAVLRLYRPTFVPRCNLPQKKQPEIYIPTELEIKKLMQAVSGTEMEIPVLLAAFGPMRRGEICALRSDNVSDGFVHVCENMVMDENNNYVIKAPKTLAGDRYIDFPDFVMAALEAKRKELYGDGNGRLVNLTPMALTHRFEHVVKNAGLPRFHFHSLRHYSASILHTMMSDEYIMQRGGWATDSTLKQVYRHALDDKAREANAKANAYFERISHEISHATKKTAQVRGL